MFPDGTPISYTEVAAFRRYATGVDDFARFDDFLPREEHDGDVTYPLAAGATYTATLQESPSWTVEDRSTAVGAGAGCEDVAGSCMGACPSGMGCGSDGHGCVCVVAPMADGLFETTVWAAYPGDGNMTMVVRANAKKSADEREPQIQTHPQLQLEEESTCSQDKAAVLKGVDIYGADFKGIHYRTFDVSKDADAVSACTAACCAWDGCAAWIVQSGTVPSKNDGNCTKTTTDCCWLKPDGKGAHILNAKSIAGVVTATPPRPIIPPPAPPPPLGPPSPHNVSGYHVVLVGASKSLVVERRDASGGIVTLGKFDLSTLENGLVLEAWNILRALVETVENSSGEIEGVKLSVWFNPMFPETG